MGMQRESLTAFLSLNAPYGAWCFLTGLRHRSLADQGLQVLMHLMALGVF